MKPPALNQLRLTDFRNVYMLLGACREPRGRPAAWCRKLSSGLESILGIQLVAMFEGSLALSMGEGLPTADSRIFIAGNLADKATGVLKDFWSSPEPVVDPVLAAWKKIAGTIVSRSRRHLAEDALWHRSAAFQQYFRRAEIKESIIARFPVGNHRWMMVNFWRSVNDRPFTESEQQIIDLLIFELSRMLQSNELNQLLAEPEILPKRLREILTFLCKGYSEKQIAHELCLSIHTVHNHCRRLHQKLKVCSRGELIAKGISENLTIDSLISPFPPTRYP